MAMTAVYTNFCGQIVNQVRDGVNRDIIPDPLGSTAHLVDDTQTKRASYTYTPYGEIESHSGETTPLNFVGTLGYYRDAANSTLTYIRARWYKAMYGRWMAVDPLWPDEAAYVYAKVQPNSQIDATGLASKPCTLPILGLGPICFSKDCVFNTNEYAEDCRKTGNKLSCCASCVSKAICVLIYIGDIEPVVGKPLSKKAQCQNSCMIDMWRDKKTDLWRRAVDICKRTGQNSRACCLASVRAEQDGYTRCARQCFGELNGIPYEVRVAFAKNVLKCCE